MNPLDRKGVVRPVGKKRRCASKWPGDDPQWVAEDPAQALEEVVDYHPERLAEFLGRFERVYQPQQVDFTEAECISWGQPPADPVMTVILEGDAHVIDASGVKSAREFVQDIYDMNLYQYAPSMEENFWENPQVVFHGTPEHSVESILANGIRASSESRGLSNRSIGDAVFAHPDLEYAEYFYGTPLAINAPQMKADGYMPPVEGETPFAEERQRAYIADRLGVDDWTPASYDSEGLDEQTIAFRGDIPSKYVSLVRDDIT